MKVAPGRIRPHTVARVLSPAAMLVLLSGMAISARNYYAMHYFNPGGIVLSDFENREDNPRGYAYAATGTALACGLLFAAAPLLGRAIAGGWCRAGVWIYGAGSVSGILMAALEPFLEPYHPLHILLAFATFLGFICGLGCISIAAARARLWPGRGVWATAAGIYAVAALLALEIIPLPHRGSPGIWNSLAAGELTLATLIAVGTAGLAEACARASASTSLAVSFRRA